MNLLVLLFMFNMLYIDFTQSAKILGVFPPASKSTFILGNSLLKGLAEAGHNVTMISPFEDRVPPSRGYYRNIVLTGFLERSERKRKSLILYEKFSDKFGYSNLLINILGVAERDLIDNTNIINFLNSNEKYDAVIIPQFKNDVLKIFAHHFKAHLILFCPFGISSWVNKFVGNPSPISYIPLTGTKFSPQMSFPERFCNLVYYIIDIIIDNSYYFPIQKEMLRKFYTNPPPFNDLLYNVSLVLVNSHESVSQPVPFVPNMIDIGGFHLQQPKQLPKDLQEYLDNAEHGVIYFSMGSILENKNMSKHKMECFLKAFSKLKVQVLMKWESDTFPIWTTNIKFLKWIPQADILAHPNTKLFITHGGISSIIEAVNYAIPILVLPIYGDQFANANMAVLGGYALTLSYIDPSFSEEKLLSMLTELLENPRYKNNAETRSKIFHDRPVKPLENAIYWIEYVIRHQGAPHLRVAGVDLPWYKYYLVDVVALLMFCVLLIMIVFYLINKKVTDYVKKIIKRKQYLKEKSS